MSGENNKILYDFLDQDMGQGVEILELGVEHGISTMFFCNLAQKYNGHVTAIDHWEGRDTQYRDFLLKCQRKGCDRLLSVYRANLFMLFDVFKEESFDIIYFDAVYTWPSVMRCLKLYLPLLKKGGTACGPGANGYWSKLDDIFKEEFVLSQYHNFIEVPIKCTDKEGKPVTWIYHTNLTRALFEMFHDEHLILPESTIWLIKKA